MYCYVDVMFFGFPWYVLVLSSAVFFFNVCLYAMYIPTEVGNLLTCHIYSTGCSHPSSIVLGPMEARIKRAAMGSSTWIKLKVHMCQPGNSEDSRPTWVTWVMEISGCIYLYSFVYFCIYVSMYLCMYVSMYVCMYICINQSIYLSIHLSICLSIDRT